MIQARKVFLYTTLFMVLTVFLTYLLDGKALLMPGALSGAHKNLSKDCNRCHTSFKNDFKSCALCHLNPNQISLHSKGEVPCISCHISHEGQPLILESPLTCLSKACHGKMRKLSDHSGDPEICFDCHPEHQSEKKMPDIVTSDLIFSHRIHTDKSNLKAYYPCSSCHHISSNGITMDQPKALIQCAKCHSNWVGIHDVKKSIAEPKCALCHYAEKKEIKGLGKNTQLKHARFDHWRHVNIECKMCHFPMETFNELGDIFIYSSQNKRSFCAKCHPNPFIQAN